ncbi:MSMEG_0567/sll0787 family protein [Nocardia bovistercoris]|uniref:GNAT family N-acetyltransferase n=1 Tax=Nocardia bovistercoris TaxID=2785916 RepID=A0A931N074_9NOCA|nr:MSMEG_0567/sll0787 family protein [Nocardia bovistercoris]MBH0776945.1 GNAT family N-acetyltransferase [Nocardia bovistercoris]
MARTEAARTGVLRAEFPARSGAESGAWTDHLAAQPVSSAADCVLSGRAPSPPFLIRVADRPLLAAYRALRRENFVVQQGLFTGSDADDIDDDPRARVLVALTPEGELLGGVRLAPATETDIGWWTGSRLVVDGRLRTRGVGQALVRAACACAETEHVLRFEATVQSRYAPLFTRLGWTDLGRCEVGGVEHRSMRWPIDRVRRLVEATKSVLSEALAPLDGHAMTLGGNGFRGDDGAPVPGSDLIAACDAIIPSMVERDPEWAGWCAALVNLNDLSAMGAHPVGMLDAVGAPTKSLLTRVLRGLARAARTWDVPVLGGHTQLGVPAALSVTALGRTERPVPGGGGRLGDEIRLTADLSGGWRPGYTGRQWDSSSHRDGAELRAMGRFVARTAPHAAKDVSMAGLAGTIGMLAEASGVGAELEVARIPRPSNTTVAEWITCFPGFAMITADRPGASVAQAGPATSALCGVLTSTPGVGLRWPDGTTTVAVPGAVTGLGQS